MLTANQSRDMLEGNLKVMPRFNGKVVFLLKITSLPLKIALTTFKYRMKMFFLGCLLIP
jgi:hypothetical protein